MKSEIAQAQSSRDDHAGTAVPAVRDWRTALRVMALRDRPSASDPSRHDAGTSLEWNATSSGEPMRAADFVLAAIDALLPADNARLRARWEGTNISAATSTPRARIRRFSSSRMN